MGMQLTEENYYSDIANYEYMSVSQLIYRTLPSGMLSREHGTLRSTDHRNYRTYLHWVKKYSAIHRRVPRWHPPFNFNNIF